jgi:MFS family permease
MNPNPVRGLFNRQITRSRELFDRYPRQLWTLVATMAVDELGGGLLFPFLTLYVTRKFEISMTRVGFLFMVYMLAGFFGNILGGASSDKIGRKITAVTGLITSAACSVLLGLSSTYSSFIMLAFLAGFFGSFGLPAWIAMIADLLPEHQHT